MARDSLLNKLISKVSAVSAVKAPIYTGLPDTPTDLLEVLRVSTRQPKASVVAASCEIYTPNSLTKNKRYQFQSPWILGCTLVTCDTQEEFNADTKSVKSLCKRKRIQHTNLPGYPAEPQQPEITGRKHKL